MTCSGSPHRGLCYCATRSIPGHDGMELIRAATSSPQGQRPPELMRGSQAGRMPCARRLRAQNKRLKIFRTNPSDTKNPPAANPELTPEVTRCAWQRGIARPVRAPGMARRGGRALARGSANARSQRRQRLVLRIGSVWSEQGRPKGIELARRSQLVLWLIAPPNGAPPCAGERC